MEPSMSTKDRHTDVKKTEFLRQIVKHEQNLNDANVSKCPRSRPFVFKQTYALSSRLNSQVGIPKEQIALNTKKKTSFKQNIIDSESVQNTSHGFSSFRFGSAPASEILGQHIDNTIFPKRMSLQEQRKYGGASMAGLVLKETMKKTPDSWLTRVADADPKHQHLVYEAAVAFPALAVDDPALFQLMETVDVLESRRTHLRNKLSLVDDKIKNWEQ